MRPATAVQMVLIMAALSLTVTYAAMPMITSSPPLGDPLPGLTADELSRFTQGKAVFSHDFKAATGLGPFFNNTSCAQCHEDPVTGGAGSIRRTSMSSGMPAPAINRAATN